ncbi:MAG: sigma-70 family RNA polymerase sigma factor [Clostridium sp.]|nr:sigma-70 family RNA polymerase sigma factor [Clostridium sp.]
MVFKIGLRELDTIQEQRDLIEKLIKSNNKYFGNEDLLEDFCSETYKRSHSLFDSVGIKDIENYIAKVANTAILNVLKENGRVRRRKDTYVSTKEILISPIPAKTPVENTPITDTSNISQDGFVYEIADPRDSFEEKIVRRDLLQKVVDIVLVAQKNNPSKEYLKIFYLRYVKELKQKEIAAEINISQSEVSKRLIEISEIVKTHF